MAKRFTFKKLMLLMISSGVFFASPHINAAAFQLFEQDGASIGNYHAGRSAVAEDASTAFYNPAGLVRIKNQQLVLGLDPVVTDIKFHGTVDVNTVGLGTVGPVSAPAQGGGLNFVPDLNYAAPITDRFVFGFSIVAPFGLKTDYGTTSFTRYASTLTSLQVIDFSPSLGIALTDKFSIGAGVDIERSSAEFDLVAGNSLLNSILGSIVDINLHQICE
jgi:long-chain fatty acid transport protein